MMMTMTGHSNDRMMMRMISIIILMLILPFLYHCCCDDSNTEEVQYGGFDKFDNGFHVKEWPDSALMHS